MNANAYMSMITAAAISISCRCSELETQNIANVFSDLSDVLEMLVTRRRTCELYCENPSLGGCNNDRLCGCANDCGCGF